MRFFPENIILYDEGSGISNKSRLFHSLFFPLAFQFVIWLVWSFGVLMEINLSFLGVMPREWAGLAGILTAPLIHGDIEHIFNNSLTILALSVMVFYFYRPVAYRVFFMIYLFSGIGIWLIGRTSYHIGASGIIYGLAFFLFLSGLLSKTTGMLAISLLIVFMYGSMVWYLFPIPTMERISWEGHSMGALTGVALAFVYQKYGPRRKPYDWELEDDEKDDDMPPTSNEDKIEIHYHLKKDDDPE